MKKKIICSAIVLACLSSNVLSVFADEVTTSSNSTDDSSSETIVAEDTSSQFTNDALLAENSSDGSNDSLDDEEDTEQVFVTGDEDEHDTATMEIDQQDPTFYKYYYIENGEIQERIQLFAANYTVSGLSHNSKFDNMEKVYVIDVSQWQGSINWSKVKAAGIDYAIIRAGYRGYGSAGTLCKDSYFDQNIKNATAAGIKVGVYFYTEDITTTEAKASANFVTNLCKNYKLDLPIYYDIEATESYGRFVKAGLSQKQKYDLCVAFCNQVKATGYDAGVYSYYSYFNNVIGSSYSKSLGEKYPVWLAHYSTKTDYAYNYIMWQFSSSKYVDGISGKVDMSVWYKSKETSVTTDPITVDQVKNLKLTADGTQANLTWDSASGADYYRVLKYDYKK